MCGVIGLVYEHLHPQLGRIAAELLKTLEYRGYDSTGAVIQGADELDVRLAKGVGAPSLMVHRLGIVGMAGQVLCGQVRWATFGAVTDQNSQPHLVRCHAFLYGAHNGNVTNCDDLKRWLTAAGHAVLSDNDGEMVVHTVEHCFALRLAGLPEAERRVPAARRQAMRAAIVEAAARLAGSYAAVIVDPVTRTGWAIKQGSSLYFGFGVDATAGRFAIASSDLSSVLKLTRTLLPLSDGEFIEYDPEGHTVYSLRDRRLRAQGSDLPVEVQAGEALPRAPVRSRLRAKDTALLPGFSTFMEQEIAAQPAAAQGLASLLLGGSPAARQLGPHLDALAAPDRRAVEDALDGLRDLCDDVQVHARFHALMDLSAFRRLLERVPASARAGLASPVGAAAIGDELASAEAGFLADLLPLCRDAEDLLGVRLLDALLERAEVAELADTLARFSALCVEALRQGARLLVVSCGSSYHAARAGALFFNEIAGVPLHVVLPGEFRGEHARSLRDGDVIIAVSQSGETKDLIDVLNQVEAGGRGVTRVAVVNNLNSTLAQEKSDFQIPLRCGPEIAVPATKSFLSQVLVFYGLALRLGERLAAGLPPAARATRAAALGVHEARLRALPALLREALTATAADVEAAAEMLYLCPSIHLLATRLTAVALEGALKIREVVLNHTEGFEGSEFKHGPNTILGFNTLFGPRQVEAALAAAAGPRPPALGPLMRSLAVDYPLIYITGPDEQDVNLTVSQINTHKIRGASSVVVAEDHPALRQAAGKAPADNPGYRSAYIALPRTGDTLMTVFSATVVLQRLALSMSLRKKAYLDALGVPDHGVHPDVPKNVSKSITVD